MLIGITAVMPAVAPYIRRIDVMEGIRTVTAQHYLVRIIALHLHILQPLGKVNGKRINLILHRECRTLLVISPRTDL